MGTDATCQSMPSYPQLWLSKSLKNVTWWSGTFSRAGSSSLSTAKPWFQINSMSWLGSPAQNTVLSISFSFCVGLYFQLLALDLLHQKILQEDLFVKQHKIFWFSKALCPELMAKIKLILSCNHHVLHSQFNKHKILQFKTVHWIDSHLHWRCAQWQEG